MTFTDRELLVIAWALEDRLEAFREHAPEERDYILEVSRLKARIYDTLKEAQSEK